MVYVVIGSHGIVVYDNMCKVSSIVKYDSIDNVNMNRPRCLDGVALINAYVVKKLRSTIQEVYVLALLMLCIQLYSQDVLKNIVLSVY